MKRSINSCESGSSVISIPNGNAVAGSGKFERKKCGAPPTAVRIFETWARWSISSTATCAIFCFQPRIASSSSCVIPPSSGRILMEYPAYR